MKKRKKKRPTFSPQSRTVCFEDGFGDYPMGYRGQPSVTAPRFFLGGEVRTNVVPSSSSLLSNFTFEGRFNPVDLGGRLGRPKDCWANIPCLRLPEPSISLRLGSPLSKVV